MACPHAQGCLCQNSHFVVVGTCCVTSRAGCSPIYVDLQRTEMWAGKNRELAVIGQHTHIYIHIFPGEFLQDITPGRSGRRKFPPSH